MTRSLVATYVGLVALLMIYFVSTAYFSRPEFDWIVALADPFGLGAVYARDQVLDRRRSATRSCQPWPASC